MAVDLGPSQEYVKFNVASAAFGSFIEFLFSHLKDSVVSKRVVFILWLCRFLFCLSVCLFVCLFGWLGGGVGWLVCWVVDLFVWFVSFLFCFGLAWLDLFGFCVVC